MAIRKLLRAVVPGALLRWGARLRFPYLFLLMAVLFVVDLAIPDAIPLVDEVLFGLATLLLASWKKNRSQPELPGGENDS